jgi:hypothetical protein
MKAVAALAATVFGLVVFLLGTGIAKADNCYTDCYQNGTQYQCTTNCY